MERGEDLKRGRFQTSIETEKKTTERRKERYPYVPMQRSRICKSEEASQKLSI